MKNGRISTVYDGQVADDLTEDELIKAILKEIGLAPRDTVIAAMNEAFRCGFLRGEEYGRQEVVT